jgi:predicted kinase
MKKLIILRGLPASGKSTYAKSLLEDNLGMYKRLNKDELRQMLDNNHHTKSNEKFIERVRDMMLLEALKEGKHVVIDDTNLSDRPIERLRQVVQNYCKNTGDQVQIEVKNIETTLQECLDRDEKRDKKVGKNVIMRMYKQHIMGDERGPHYKAQNADLPKAIICDLDGTLAVIKDRNPFDALACELDLLNEPIADLVKMYRQNNCKVVLMSGRDEAAKQPTLNWLAKHNIEFDEIYMRTVGDTRKDSIVKKELFETHVANRYFIQMVLDDRDQVVDLWRLELGLPCVQVNYGDF